MKPTYFVTIFRVIGVRSIIQVWIIRFADYPCMIVSLIYQVFDS
jgi:hypothetical protein